MSKSYLTDKRAKKDQFYYLNIFRIEGHTTWRAILSGTADGFDKQIKTQTQGVQPAVTDRRVYKINRLSGEVGGGEDLLPTPKDPLL